MSSRVKNDDERKKQLDRREARGELWRPGMPIEGDDEQPRDFPPPFGGPRIAHHINHEFMPRNGAGLMPGFGGPAFGPPGFHMNPTGPFVAQQTGVQQQGGVANRAAEEQARMRRNQERAALNNLHQSAVNERQRRFAMQWQAIEDQEQRRREQVQQQWQARRARNAEPGASQPTHHQQGRLRHAFDQEEARARQQVISGHYHIATQRYSDYIRSRANEGLQLHMAGNLFAGGPAAQDLRIAVNEGNEPQEWQNRAFMGPGPGAGPSNTQPYHGRDRGGNKGKQRAWF